MSRSRPISRRSSRPASGSSPDVAFDGDPSTGASVYYTPPTAAGTGQSSATQGSWYAVGGTSLGARRLGRDRRASSTRAAAVRTLEPDRRHADPAIALSVWPPMAATQRRLPCDRGDPDRQPGGRRGFGWWGGFGDWGWSGGWGSNPDEHARPGSHGEHPDRPRQPERPIADLRPRGQHRHLARAEPDGHAIADPVTPTPIRAPRRRRRRHRGGKHHRHKPVHARPTTRHTPHAHAKQVVKQGKPAVKAHSAEHHRV